MKYQFDVGQTVVFEIGNANSPRKRIATITVVWRNGVSQIDARPAYTFDEYGQRRGQWGMLTHVARIRPLALGETPESIAAEEKSR